MRHSEALYQFNQVIMIIGIYIRDNKTVIITETKAIYFDLPKNIDENEMLEHEIDSIIKTKWPFSWAHNKNDIRQLLSKCKPGNNNHEFRK